MKKSQPASNNAMVNKSLDDTGKISHISQASSDYARCIANPFNGPISGVPTAPTTLSFNRGLGLEELSKQVHRMDSDPSRVLR
jgi:hypothetical protein